VTSPWLFGRSVDLAVFGGSALVALGLVAAGPWLSDGGSLPAWGFLALVVAVDVAHVWTTLFRTYFDREELRRRRALYAGVPLACFAAGVALHAASQVWFWRALAYVAVFHFVRQQVGWVAVYRARARETSRLGRIVDHAAIYAATGYPLAWWHAHPPRAFEWFVEGDFVTLDRLRSALPVLGALTAAILAVYAIRAAQDTLRGRPNFGKHLVVATTAITWFTGIVATNTDFQFTAANVLVHGAPYVALLYVYAKARAAERPRAIGARVLGLGFAGFYGVVVALAFFEEAVWDRLVWHAHPTLFGGSEHARALGPVAMAVVVPLLAVPQATHYVLDAVLWRRRDARHEASRAQAVALGFAPRVGDIVIRQPTADQERWPAPTFERGPTRR
jgi:hypothetical protein